MRIQMTETRRGSEDGLKVRCYENGQTYDMERHLACAFLAAGCAIPAWEQTSIITAACYGTERSRPNKGRFIEIRNMKEKT